MNLGGIKVSSEEIERVLHDMPDVQELAAIADFNRHHTAGNRIGGINPRQLLVDHAER